MSTNDVEERALEPDQREVAGTRADGRSRALLLKLIAVLVTAVAVLAVIFVIGNDRAPEATGHTEGARPRGAGEHRFAVGEPGPGDAAISIRLPSTEGGIFDLASLRGQTVLLYFQEGLMCQPCWDQLKDIEQQWNQFEALGVDAIVSITTDPIDALKQKVTDEELSTPVVSDFDPMVYPERSVQEAYQTNRYGMMGKMHSGHSLIVVGPDGTILWRADYGGAPDYTMYLPVRNLIADMQVGLETSR